MHPNLYLRTFWTSSFRPEVFVAMSFGESMKSRFTDVVKPAVEANAHHGVRLSAKRVDLSKSGDSILTDIADGIAHSSMVLADVSVVGYDAKTGQSYRNGNVMYEVGLALACRQSAEVLLIRDDRDRFLFDVSTVPHKHIDFSNLDEARSALAEEIGMRLREIDHVLDARIAVAVASLTAGERQILAAFADYGMNQTFWLTKENMGSLAALPRLLDKQLILTKGATREGRAMFGWTELGRVVADNLQRLVPVIELPKVEVKGIETHPGDEVLEATDGTEQPAAGDGA